MLSLADQHLLVSTPEWVQRLYNSYEELHQLITLYFGKLRKNPVLTVAPSASGQSQWSAAE